MDPKTGKPIDQRDLPPSNDPPTLSTGPASKHDWVPGGKFELPEYPPPPKPLNIRRPLSAATYRPNSKPSQRTVPQIEETLRRWLIRNRRLHEDKRLTLVRGLTSALRVPKDTSGIPLRLLETPKAQASYYSIAQEDNFRTSKAALASTMLAARKPGETNVDFGSLSATGVGNLPPPIDLDAAATAAVTAADDETFAEAMLKIKEDPDLNAAERWGYEYRMRVALKRALSHRGNAKEVWGTPSVKPVSHKLQLIEV